MARRSTIDKRKLRATLQRELAIEASRMLPELSRDIAQSLMPLAAALASQRAKALYQDATQQAETHAEMRPRMQSGGETRRDDALRTYPAPRNTAERTDGAKLQQRGVNVDVDTKALRDSSDALERLGAAFDTAIVKGGKLDNMLRTTAGGFGKLIAASDSEAAKKAFGALFKDLGTQAISGVQAMLLAAEAQSAVKGVLSFGSSLAVDAPLIAAAYVALEGAKAYINSLDRGGVLLGDQLIMAHDKETVIPFEKAPAFFAEAVNRGAGARDTLRSVYRPEEQTSTAARVRVSFGEMRGALRQSEIRQSRRSA